MIVNIAKYVAVIAFIGALIGGTWSFGDTFGFRPALKSEVEAVKGEVEVVGQSVAWIRLENYERRLDRGLKLSRRECADYRRLARRLGVDPKPC